MTDIPPTEAGALAALGAAESHVASLHAALACGESKSRSTLLKAYAAVDEARALIPAAQAYEEGQREAVRAAALRELADDAERLTPPIGDVLDDRAACAAWDDALAALDERARKLGQLPMAWHVRRGTNTVPDHGVAWARESYDWRQGLVVRGRLYRTTTDARIASGPVVVDDPDVRPDRDTELALIEAKQDEYRAEVDAREAAQRQRVVDAERAIAARFEAERAKQRQRDAATHAAILRGEGPNAATNINDRESA